MSIKERTTRLFMVCISIFLLWIMSVGTILSADIANLSDTTPESELILFEIELDGNDSKKSETEDIQQDELIVSISAQIFLVANNQIHSVFHHYTQSTSELNIFIPPPEPSLG